MADEKKQYLIFCGIVVAILVFFVAAMYAPKEASPQPSSTLSLDPSSVMSPTVTSEPASETLPYSWENYTNDDFDFAVDYPEKWYKQNYVSDPHKGAFIAFSPEPLPCETCSYLNDGYYTIKLYNQKTDPESYAGFLQRMKSIGKVEGYRPVSIGGKQGVWFENAIAIENEGWVYELSFDKEGIKITDSLIFKRVLSSFKFTSLMFND